MTILVLFGAWSAILIVLIRLFIFLHACDEEISSLVTRMRMPSDGRVVSSKERRIGNQSRGTKARRGQHFAPGSPGAVNISHS